MIVYALFFDKTFFVDKKPEAVSTNIEEDIVNDGTNQKNDNDGN